MVLITF